MRDAENATVRLSEYAPPAYLIDEIALVFMLEPEATIVAASSHVRRSGAAPAPLELSGERLDLQSISIDGEPLSMDKYRLEPGKLIILDPPAAFRLDIVTRINPAGNTHLEGLYMSGGRFCTQCEAEGFRAITYFLDRPDVLARYAVRIEADWNAYPTLLSNGNLTESGEMEGNRHYAVWVDPTPSHRTCSRSAPANTSRSTMPSPRGAAVRSNSAFMSIPAIQSARSMPWTR